MVADCQREQLDWKVDLSKNIKQFNDTYENKKGSLMKNLTKAHSFEEQKPILDDFFSSMES